MILRPFQEAGVEDGVRVLLSGNRRMYGAPTGVGKSIVELKIAERTGAWIVAPKLEIVAGMLAKLDEQVPTDEDRLAELGQSRGIWTPVRLRNQLLAGRLAPPPYLIIDEGHHDAASIWQDISALCGLPPSLAFSASPYRGTPRGTAALRAIWGEPHWLITYADAVRQGYISLPSFRVVPLLDDDLVEVRDGELVASQVSRLALSRLEAAVDEMRPWWLGDRWDKPTMVAVPSTEVAKAFTAELDARGMIAARVGQDTSAADRAFVFDACVRSIACLVQVKVVSEGVDLPIRRLFDLSPTLSPVNWVQQIGRITRPGGNSEYVCANRNLFRHAYTMGGMVPVADLKAAEVAFPARTQRTAVRAIGMEALGRLKAAELPLANGLTGLCYCVSAVHDSLIKEYCAIVCPHTPRIFWAERTSAKIGEGKSYGRWAVCDPPEGLEGFASINAGPLSERQLAWWKNRAKVHGLDSTVEPTRRAFAALPVLADTGRRLV